MSVASSRSGLLTKLTGVVSKAKLYSPSFAHLDFRVYQEDGKKDTYFIEVYQGRCSRMVVVDPRTAENVRQGYADVILLKEVRSALQQVAAQAKESESQAARIAARRR
jgi:hypothetical protein